MIEILGETYELIRLSPDVFHLAKPEDKGKGYIVRLSPGFCSCPDYRYRSQKRIEAGLNPDCKHLTALRRAENG